MTHDTPLPLPTRDRWQPLRAGLVDLYHYDYEELWFRDGRLLLRGNNGTGKSKVMALTLPFLLDGRLSPARVEPDGDSGKRMEWNLLLSGKYSERQGYSWLEFGRLENGVPVYFTLGCGLKAVAGRGAPRSWFFTTPQRVGESLFLLESGRTLTRERLIEALGSRGQHHDTAESYRRAIDERLFQLGPERFEALINLLIQLRQPQLSKKPDPFALSRTLTEALPPLDQAVLAEVADAFRNLDAERDELTALQEAARAVEEFLLHYREYARICARRRGRAVRGAQSRYEDRHTRLNQRRAELTDLATAQAAREAQLAALAEGLEAAGQEERTLEASPEMRSAAELRSAEAEAAGKRRLAVQLRELYDRGAARLAQVERQGAARRGELAQSADGLLARAERAGAQAAGAGIAVRFAGALAPLGLPDPAPGAPLAEAERAVGGVLARRREAADHLKGLNRQVEAARGAEGEARERWQRALDEGERLDEARQAAAGRVREAGRALVAGSADYCRGLTEIPLHDPEPLAAELDDWVLTLDGENPLIARLEPAKDQALARLGAEQARAEQARAALVEQKAQLEAEQARLLAGDHARPPVPHTRDESARAGRPGAPLWQLIDFAEAVPAQARAGLEAALEGAGLLDAWLLPDGRLLAPDLEDTLLTLEAPLIAANLTTLLVPAVDRGDPRSEGVTDTAVARVLAAIGRGPGSGAVWVSPEGGWGLGPAQGRWHKPEAQYIGRGAREAARRRRLEAIREALAQLDEALAGADAALTTLHARRARLLAEWAARPDDRPLRDAWRDELAALRAREAHQQAIDAAADRLREAREQLTMRTRLRDEAAAELDLPVDPAQLEQVSEAVAELRLEWTGLAAAIRRHQDLRGRLAEAEQEEAQLREQAAEQSLRCEEAEREARAAEVHRDTLRETIGAAVDAVLRRLGEVRARITQMKQEQESEQQARAHTAGRIGQLTSAVAADEEALAAIEEERRGAIERLRALAAEGLLRIALPDLEGPDPAQPWAADPAVRFARRMEGLLAAVDDGEGAWNRNQKGLYQHFSALAAALARHGHEAAAEQSEELILVRIVFQSRPRAPDELAAGLLEEISARRALLDNRERELIEKHLVSDVASHLQERIAWAEGEVVRMNRELESRPTSTGMKLRLAWQPREESESGAPTGFKEARERLLRQVIDAWSAEDREAVGSFLKQRIDEARAANEVGSLVDLLDRALDYRRWHGFVVERFQDGKWRPAYGPASGGERALVITIPLFAAASSHYGSASPHAPRLVMLDEAFAGIDDDSRAKCMGLLAHFDLDIMMTSEREWGCYPEVPGLSICQLVRREGVDAIFVSRWGWDGHRRTREEPTPPLLEPPERVVGEPAVGSTGSLF